MYVDPVTRAPLRDFRSSATGVLYPQVDGIPILVEDPKGYLQRHTARTAEQADPHDIDAPDPITPHLPANMLGAPGGFGQYLAGVGDAGPDAFGVGFGSKYAPEGPALDAGCGLAPMARRMVALGRDTWALDVSLDAVLLARGLLCGGLPTVGLPTHRNGKRQVRVPFKPITSGLHFAVADAALPPFAPGSFAWVHLGDVLDDVGDAVGDVLVASAELLPRGGVLTLHTAYGARVSDPSEKVDPQEEVLEALDGLGFDILEQADRIPHVVRHYDRHFAIRFVHCVAARRR